MPVTGDNPRQAPREGALCGAAPRRTGAFQRSVVGGQKLDRVELAGHTNARTLAAPEIPDGPVVAGDLSVKERRELARHGGALWNESESSGRRTYIMLWRGGARSRCRRLTL